MGRHRDRSSLALLLSAVATIVLWYGRPTRQTSYTILTMTYEKRGAMVEGFIGHYETCGGLDSILVVWNGPDMESTIDTAHIHATSRVPVRFRAEGKPSLNNRYRPDPHLSYIDALLILDDDLRIDCDSVQRALSAFHRSRRQDIVGWFPRFAMLGTPHSYYLGEPRTIKRGEYNLILSGAAFVDHRRYFELYWAPELAEMRAVVDVRSHLSLGHIRQLPTRPPAHTLVCPAQSEWNCDDLLFNFVVATAGGGSHYLRAGTITDLSRTTGVGISHDEDGFVRKAADCLRRFHEHFGDTRLKTSRFRFSEDGEIPPDCDERRSKLFCQY